MTQKQFLTKIDELIKITAKDMHIKVREFIRNDGTVNLDNDNWENDYRFPKIVMAALCKESAYQWTPLTRADRKQVTTIENQL